MLPFLKRREGGAASAPVEVKERKPDDEMYDMLDAIAEDILVAVEKKNKTMLKMALESFVDHIQAIDAEMDKELME